MSEVVGYRQKVRWFRAPSGAGHGLEIGRLPHGDYAIRNSAFRANTVVVTEQELTDFIRAVHVGKFDKIVEVIR